MNSNIIVGKNVLELLTKYFQQYQKDEYSEHLKTIWDNILLDWSNYSAETRFQLMVIYNEHQFKLLNLQDPRFKNPSMNFFYHFEEQKWKKLK
tara:strand:- start:1366 stop:1644 length:279 start_codon:yes stop_codon:yes gene_type:complete